MTKENRKGALVLKAAALASLGALAACGIKNEPVAPKTGKTPPVVVEKTRQGGADVVGGPNRGLFGNNDRRGSGANGVADRIVGVNTDDSVGAAEVTRNANATGRHFFLDPLLN